MHNKGRLETLLQARSDCNVVGRHGNAELLHPECLLWWQALTEGVDHHSLSFIGMALGATTLMETADDESTKTTPAIEVPAHQAEQRNGRDEASHRA